MRLETVVRFSARSASAGDVSVSCGGLGYRRFMPSIGNAITLSSGAAQVVIAAERGGRLAELSIGGRNLLVERPLGEEPDPLTWGSYPMVPFAGRVRHGRLRFGTEEIALPITLGPHAIHGYGYVSPWTIEHADPTSARLSLRLGPPWPWPATVIQEFSLSDHRLDITMSLRADADQPVSLGWHPWFRRELDDGDTPVKLEFAPSAMYELDDEAIPTGTLIDVPDGPWDNCFAGVTRPQLSWGDLQLELSSSAPLWVVYDEPAHALCVEPQTGPPNGLNDAPDVAFAGTTTDVSMAMEWSLGVFI